MAKLSYTLVVIHSYIQGFIGRRVSNQEVCLR